MPNLLLFTPEAVKLFAQVYFENINSIQIY